MRINAAFAKKEVGVIWAAGLFDGEGCISICCVHPSSRNGLRNSSYRLVVKVTMGCRNTIMLLHRILGTGTVHRHVEGNARVNGSTTWVALARKGERAIRLMLPYLVTKRKEAMIALEFMDLPDCKRGGRQGSPRIDATLLKRKHALYAKCCKAKSRWRFRKVPIQKFTHNS